LSREEGGEESVDWFSPERVMKQEVLSKRQGRVYIASLRIISLNTICFCQKLLIKTNEFLIF